MDAISFDGTFLIDICTLALSSISQSGYDMEKNAFDLLFEKLTDEESAIKRVLILYTLNLKETTHSSGRSQPI